MRALGTIDENQSFHEERLIYRGSKIGRLIDRVINIYLVSVFLLGPSYLFYLGIHYDNLSFPAFVVISIPFVAGLFGLYGIFNMDNLTLIRGLDVERNKLIILKVLSRKYPGVEFTHGESLIMGNWKKSLFSKRSMVILFQGNSVALNIRSIGWSRIGWRESAFGVLFQEDDCREIAARFRGVIGTLNV